jgi:hypothetical protein
MIVVRGDLTGGGAPATTRAVDQGIVAPLKPRSVIVQQAPPTIRERTPLDVIWTRAPSSRLAPGES